MGQRERQGKQHMGPLSLFLLTLFRPLAMGI